MLSSEQQKTLESWVFEKLPNNPGAPQVSQFVGAQLAQQMPVAIQTYQLARWIVDLAMRSPTPDLLLKIIYVADNGSALFRPLIDIADQLTDNPSSWQPLQSGGTWHIDQDPLEVEGKPFIDRSRYRELLPRPAATVPTPICTVIGGERGSGKSYLAAFTKQFADRHQELRVACIDIKGSGEGSIAVDNVGLEIACELETDIVKKPKLHEDEHRHARNLATWIVEYTPQNSLPALIIFDGFDEVIAPAMHTLIQELISLLLLNAEAASKLRLILLGYDPSLLEQKSLAHNLSVLENIGETEIKRWYQTRFPNCPEYQYDDAVADILPRLPADRSRLRSLCNLVFASLKAF